MPRVKGGYTTRRRRKAVLKMAKGYYGSKHIVMNALLVHVLSYIKHA